MTAAHLLATNPSPSDDDIISAMSGNLCRCGTYSKIFAAIKSTAALNDADALTLSSEDVMEYYHTAANDDDGDLECSEGDIGKAFERASEVVEASYEQPFLAHATLEPMNAIARYSEGKMEVWAPTQAPDLGRIAVARVTDLSPADVTIHTTFIGGGFGRRLTQDFIGEAAAVAFHVGRPVKLLWSREEDTRHDWFRPAMLHRLSAAIKNGELTGWHHQIVGPQILDWYVRDAAPAQYPWAPKFLYDTLGSVGCWRRALRRRRMSPR